MTTLVSPQLQGDESRRDSQLSLGRAFWLLADLRIKRSKRRLLGLWRAPAAASRGSRRVSSPMVGSLGLVLWLGLMLGAYCLQSFRALADLSRQLGPENLPRHAAVLSSLQVLCLVSFSLTGSRASARSAGDDLEWLLTLPAPAWVLHAAKVAEAAAINPLGWLLLFPFYVSLALHSGLGLLAPIVALVFTLPVLLCCALLCSLVDSAPHTFSRATAFRILHLLGPLVGSLVVLFWLGAPTLSMLKLDVWSWLEAIPEFGWLPFSEPARALASSLGAPGDAIAWCVLFGVEMLVLLGFGVLGLQRFHGAYVVLGRHARVGVRGMAGSRSPVARRRFVRGSFAAVAWQELLWLKRNPSQAVRLGLAIAVLNALALQLASRARDIDPNVVPGWMLLGIGVLLLVVQVPMLERERSAIWHLASLPRPMSWLFACKTLFMVSVAALGALPAVIRSSALLTHFADAIPALVLGTTGLLSLAALQTALWFAKVSPETPTSQSRHVSRTLQLWSFAGWLGGLGLASPVTLSNLSPVLSGAALAWMFWKSSLGRERFVLDSSAPEPGVLSPAYALLTILLLRMAVGAATSEGHRRGFSPVEVTVISFTFAAALVVPASLLWLRIGRGVTEFRRKIELGAGKGPTVIVREALCWSVPAIAAHLGYAYLETHAFGGGAQPTLARQLAASPAALAAITCLAVPLVEELLFRGMLYRSLRASFGVATSLLVSSLLFALSHPIASFVPVFITSVCITLAFERARSLYAPILVHALYNGVPALIALLA